MSYHFVIIVILMELVEVVKKSKPEKIFTIHGFQKEFAQHLNSLGFNAEPIDNLKMKKLRLSEKNEKRNKTLDQFLSISSTFPNP